MNHKFEMWVNAKDDQETVLENIRNRLKGILPGLVITAVTSKNDAEIPHAPVTETLLQSRLKQSKRG